MGVQECFRIFKTKKVIIRKNCRSLAAFLFIVRNVPGHHESCLFMNLNFIAAVVGFLVEFGNGGRSKRKGNSNYMVLQSGSKQDHTDVCFK